MTLDEALAYARTRPGTDIMAVWVRTTLACILPSDVRMPRVHEMVDGTYEVEVVATMEPPPAIRALAVAMLRAADHADDYERQRQQEAEADRTGTDGMEPT